MRSPSVTNGPRPAPAAADESEMGGPTSERSPIGMPLLTALAGISTVLAVVVVDQLDQAAPPPHTASSEALPTGVSGGPAPKIAMPPEVSTDGPSVPISPIPPAPSSDREALLLDASLDARPGKAPVSSSLALGTSPAKVKVDGALSVALSAGASVRRLVYDPPVSAPTSVAPLVARPDVALPPDVPPATETFPDFVVGPPDAPASRGAAPVSPKQNRAARSVRKSPIREPETTGTARPRPKARKPVAGPKAELAPSPTPFSLPGALRPGGS